MSTILVKTVDISTWYRFISLGGRTPYDVALETRGESALKALQLRPIAPDEVNLTPKLIRYNR